MEYAIYRRVCAWIMYGSSSTATQTSFVIPIPSTDDGASRYIDLNQCASLLNRKLIKQQALVPVQVSLDCGTGDDHTSLAASSLFPSHDRLRCCLVIVSSALSSPHSVK